MTIPLWALILLAGGFIQIGLLIGFLIDFPQILRDRALRLDGQ